MCLLSDQQPHEREPQTSTKQQNICMPSSYSLLALDEHMNHDVWIWTELERHFAAAEETRQTVVCSGHQHHNRICFLAPLPDEIKLIDLSLDEPPNSQVSMVTPAETLWKLQSETLKPDSQTQNLPSDRWWLVVHSGCLVLLQSWVFPADLEHSSQKPFCWFFCDSERRLDLCFCRQTRAQRAETFLSSWINPLLPCSEALRQRGEEGAMTHFLLETVWRFMWLWTFHLQKVRILSFQFFTWTRLGEFPC